MNKKTLIIGVIILALVIGMWFIIDNRNNEEVPPIDTTPTVPTEPVEIPTEPPIEETLPTEPEVTDPTEPTEPETTPTEPEETKPTEPEKEETKPTEPEKEEEKPKPKPVVTFKDCEKTMYVVSKTLNARKGPGTDYDKIGTYAQWEYVRVTGIGSNGWYRVLFNGQVAYVAGNYLADIEVEEEEPTTPPTEPEIEDTTPPITEPEEPPVVEPTEPTEPPVTEPTDPPVEEPTEPTVPPIEPEEPPVIEQPDDVIEGDEKYYIDMHISSPYTNEAIDNALAIIISYIDSEQGGIAIFTVDKYVGEDELEIDWLIKNINYYYGKGINYVDIVEETAFMYSDVQEVYVVTLELNHVREKAEAAKNGIQFIKVFVDTLDLKGYVKHDLELIYNAFIEKAEFDENDSIDNDYITGLAKGEKISSLGYNYGFYDICNYIGLNINLKDYDRDWKDCVEEENCKWHLWNEISFFFNDEYVSGYINPCLGDLDPEYNYFLISDDDKYFIEDAISHNVDTWINYRDYKYEVENAFSTQGGIGTYDKNVAKDLINIIENYQGDYYEYALNRQVWGVNEYIQETIFGGFADYLPDIVEQTEENGNYCYRLNLVEVRERYNLLKEIKTYLETLTTNVEITGMLKTDIKNVYKYIINNAEYTEEVDELNCSLMGLVKDGKYHDLTNIMSDICEYLGINHSEVDLYVYTVKINDVDWNCIIIGDYKFYSNYTWNKLSNSDNYSFLTYEEALVAELNG